GYRNFLRRAYRFPSRARLRKRHFPGPDSFVPRPRRRDGYWAWRNARTRPRTGRGAAYRTRRAFGHRHYCGNSTDRGAESDARIVRFAGAAGTPRHGCILISVFEFASTAQFQKIQRSPYIIAVTDGTEYGLSRFFSELFRCASSLPMIM